MLCRAALKHPLRLRIPDQVPAGADRDVGAGWDGAGHIEDIRRGHVDPETDAMVDRRQITTGNVVGIEALPGVGDVTAVVGEDLGVVAGDLSFDLFKPFFCYRKV